MICRAKFNEMGTFWFFNGYRLDRPYLDWGRIPDP
jgi:hypothetical protein